MQKLELRCKCGARRVFMGRNTEEIMVEIDSTGWSDLPGGPKHQGWAPGRCMDCNYDYNPWKKFQLKGGK